MKLPTKINPDNIRDAIVDLKFKASIPESAVQGYFHQVLHKNFEFTEGSKVNPSQIGVVINQEILLNHSPYYSDKAVRIMVTGGQIHFNIMEAYIGWTEYYQTITKVLNMLLETGTIESFTRVGIRYISEYRSKSIFGYLKGEFSIIGNGNPLKNTQIRAQIDEGNFKSIVSLADNFSRQENDVVESFSLIDVDAQYLGPHVMPKDIFKIIEATHLKQKETFFSLVNEAFMNEHKPEYK